MSDSNFLTYEDMEFLLHELCYIPCTEQIKRISKKLEDAVSKTTGYKRDKEIDKIKQGIDDMCLRDMTRKRRLFNAGRLFVDNLYDDSDLMEYFDKKFKEKKGEQA